jgi:hypothetical protein
MKVLIGRTIIPNVARVDIEIGEVIMYAHDGSMILTTGWSDNLSIRDDNVVFE